MKSTAFVFILENLINALNSYSLHILIEIEK